MSRCCGATARPPGSHRGANRDRGTAARSVVIFFEVRCEPPDIAESGARRAVARTRLGNLGLAVGALPRVFALVADGVRGRTQEHYHCSGGTRHHRASPSSRHIRMELQNVIASIVALTEAVKVQTRVLAGGAEAQWAQLPPDENQPAHECAGHCSQLPSGVGSNSGSPMVGSE